MAPKITWFKINLQHILIHTNGFNTTHHNTNNTNLICRLSGNPPFYDETEEENTDMHNRIIFCRIVAGEFEFDSPYWDEISPAGTNIRIWYKFLIWSKPFKAFDVLNLSLPLFNVMQQKSWSADLWMLTRCWELLHKMRFRMDGKTIYKHTNSNTQLLFFRDFTVFCCCLFCFLPGSLEMGLRKRIWRKESVLNLRKTLQRPSGG